MSAETDAPAAVDTQSQAQTTAYSVLSCVYLASTDGTSVKLLNAKSLSASGRVSSQRTGVMPQQQQHMRANVRDTRATIAIRPSALERLRPHVHVRELWEVRRERREAVRVQVAAPPTHRQTVVSNSTHT